MYCEFDKKKELPIKLLNIFLRKKINSQLISILGIFFIKDLVDTKKETFYIRVNNIKYTLTIICSIKLWKIYMILYKFNIPIKDLLKLNINNKLELVYEVDKLLYSRVIPYSFIKRKNNLQYSKIKIIKGLNTSIYLRQSKGNRTYITVRKQNKTDELYEQLKIYIAYIISLFMHDNKIILFEKKSERYEESASVLFEKLIDEGYKNVFYILDKNNKNLHKINRKYKLNIIDNYTFKHYLYFFTAKTMIGTEMLSHSIDLRIANKYAMKKINSKRLNFVFLQHGVMYMISLASKTRKFFHKDKNTGLKRVVVSSKLEADHFTNYAKYENKDMYICGLPKFDKNKWTKDADKIIIMPTWRPWEYNQSRLSFTETPYFKMIKRIFESIPEVYKDKIIILPHPLIAEIITDVDDDIKNYMNFKDKYDDLLKEAKVLITDYSSIAYDAFYRGSNIIFYWEEKDYCMEQYGAGTNLMLNEDNCFGDICYTPEQVSDVIEKNYLQHQEKKYVDRYRKIVEFNDNKNTERLINYLKRDKLI